MTSVCVSSGPSQPKSGFGLVVDMSAAALVARFANTAGWFSAMIAAVLTGTAYELSDFCTHDPPTAPTLTASDFVDALQIGDWAARFTAQKKIQDWIGAHVWYDLCECVSGTQPTPPSYQSDPGNLPQIDPPAVNPPVLVGPCSSNTRTQSGISAGSVQMGFSNSWVGLPVTMVRVTVSDTAASGAGIQGDFTVTESHTEGATTTTVATFQLHVNPGSNYSTDVALLGDAHEMHASFAVTGGSGTSDLSITYAAFCNATPTTPVAPCCPPDPILSGQIRQILDIVNLIQRQAVPFGYVAGATHTGLSGAGAISISGILGIKVDVTTLPSSYGVAGTSPPEHFDLGFLTFGTADGFPQSFRLTRNPQVSLPARCSAFTDLDYDLAPGVVVTITELLREP